MNNKKGRGRRSPGGRKRDPPLPATRENCCNAKKKSKWGGVELGAERDQKKGGEAEGERGKKKLLWDFGSLGNLAMRVEE